MKTISYNKFPRNVPTTATKSTLMFKHPRQRHNWNCCTTRQTHNIPPILFLPQWFLVYSLFVLRQAPCKTYLLICGPITARRPIKRHNWGSIIWQAATENHIIIKNVSTSSFSSFFWMELLENNYFASFEIFAKKIKTLYGRTFIMSGIEFIFWGMFHNARK